MSAADDISAAADFADSHEAMPPPETANCRVDTRDLSGPATLEEKFLPRYDLDTRAPVVGSVRSMRSVLAPSQRLRASSVELDGLTVGHFDVAACSLVGSAHLNDGRCRQDSYNFGLRRDGSVIAAVADGLGSRKISQLGASTLCESVVDLAEDRELLDASELPILVIDAARRMEEIASVYAADPKDIGCAAVVAVIRPGLTLLARVGDSSAFSLQDGQMIELFDEPQGPVNVVGATLPRTQPEDIETAAVELPWQALTLVTDGLAGDLRHSAAVRSWLAQCWAVAVGPFSMGDSLRYRRQGSHDDRTGVVVWPARAVEEGQRSEDY